MAIIGIKLGPKAHNTRISNAHFDGIDIGILSESNNNTFEDVFVRAKEVGIHLEGSGDSLKNIRVLPALAASISEVSEAQFQEALEAMAMATPKQELALTVFREFKEEKPPGSILDRLMSSGLYKAAEAASVIASVAQIVIAVSQKV